MNGLIEQWGHVATNPTDYKLYFYVKYTQIPTVSCKPNASDGYNPPYYAFGWENNIDSFKIRTTAGGQSWMAKGY